MSPLAPDGALVQTAEEFAAGRIRLAIDANVAPNLPQIADESALSVREVEAIRDRILSGKRGTQTLGRPRAAQAPSSPQRATAAPPAGPAETPAPAVGWRAHGQHPSARVRRAVQKAVAAVEAVEALVAQEAEKAKLRQREQRLAAELAKVRAELKGDRRATSSAEKVPCPECGDPVVNSPSGLGVHRGRSKKHRAAQ